MSLDDLSGARVLTRLAVPSRLLIWVSSTSSRLDALTSVPEFAISKQKPEDAAETATLSAQLAQALNIVQGIALSHGGSKRFLGRRYALEVRPLRVAYLRRRRSYSLIVSTLRNRSLSTCSSSHAACPIKRPSLAPFRPPRLPTLSMAVIRRKKSPLHWRQWFSTHCRAFSWTHPKPFALSRKQVASRQLCACSSVRVLAARSSTYLIVSH